MVLVLCTLSDNALYLYQVSRKISQVLELLSEQTPFQYKNLQRGIFPYKMYVELWYLLSAYWLMMLYICTKSSENISKNFSVIKRT